MPKEAVRRAVETLNLTSPPVGLVDLSRVGQEAFGAQTRNGTIVKGEVVDYRVKKVKGGKQALVALRVVAYDSVNILPVNGTLERGETAVMSRKTSDQVLIVDAIRQAAFVAVRTMQGQRLPTATIRMTYSRDAEIDRGSREGFKTGDTVTVLRGPIGVCTARVGKVEPERAWISAERMIGSWAPGDTVRVPYVPIPLPPAEKSVFDPPRRCFGPTIAPWTTRDPSA